MTLLRPIAALALLSGLPAAPGHAQLAPITVPRGLFRLDFGGKFDNWDRRFVNGAKLDAGSDFTYDPFDGRFLASLDSAAAALQRVTGIPSTGLSLGRTSSPMLVNIGTGSIGAAYGITSRLTIFGTVPIVRIRVQNRFDIDTVGATAGINPALGAPPGSGTTGSFLAELQSALTTISNRLSSGTFDSDPVRKALAQDILASGTPLNTNLQSLFGAAFLPLAGSAAAGALTAPIDALRASIESLAEPGVTLGSSPALPAAPPTSTQFEDFATNADGPLHSRTFTAPLLQYIGDIEVGSAFTWLDHRPKGGRIAIRSVLVGTVRLRTGQLDRPDNFFDLGTGDRQPDVQGDLITDVARGALGLRLSGRYVLQLSGRQERRLSPPDQPFAAAATLAAVEWDPGEITEGAVEPFLRIGPTLALSAGVRYWSKAADRYTYVRNQPPIEGTSPDVLAIGSKQKATAFYGGLTFSHDGVRRDGTRGMPMDAWLRFEAVTRSTEGRVPASQVLSLMIRFYRKGF